MTIISNSYCQGLITKEQGDYFYGFINSLPIKCNVTSSFAEEVKNNHQKAFLTFWIYQETGQLCESTVLYRENYKPEIRLQADVFETDHQLGYLQSCLVYATKNLAYIITYAKGIYENKAIAIIWIIQDGLVVSMLQDIVLMNKFSNNDNMIWHRLLLKDNTLVIRKYAELSAFTLYGYDGTFIIKK